MDIKSKDFKWIVYQTTCLTNNKIYIGVHKTININDSYIGCGVYRQSDTRILEKRKDKLLFVRAVKKYGYNSFKRDILFIFNNAEDAYKKEQELVNKEFLLRDDVYNTKIGGNRGPSLLGTNNYNTAKEYVIWKENGDIIIFKNLKVYCKINNLHYGTMKSRSNAQKKFILDGMVVFHRNHYEAIKDNIKGHIFYLPKSKKIKKKRLYKHKNIFIFSPSGEKIFVGNSYDYNFLQQIGLTYSNLRVMLTGKSLHAKGYTKSLENHYKVVTYFIKDNKDVVPIFNIKRYCRDNNLDFASMFDVKNGKTYSYKNYTLWQK